MTGTDLFGQPATAPEKLRGGYPRRPGSGPTGETCGTCRNCIATGPHSRVYYKCKVLQFRWTHGPGTDIKKKTPACEMWESR